MLTLTAVALVGAAVAAPGMLAAVAPGVYKGYLYQANGKKIASAPAVVSVAKNKVKVTAAKFPILCPSAMGTFEPNGTMPLVFEAPLKGNAVAAKYPAPNGEVAIYSISGTFTGKTFAGKVTYTGRCKGSYAVRTA